MGVAVNISDQWQAGPGTPVKYGYNVNSVVDVVQNGNTANFTWHGTITIFNNPYNSRNVWQASDFAAFIKGDTNLANWGGFGNCYKHGLPFGGNGPTNNIILEYRGDTWRYGTPNGSSLWVSNQGTVLNEDTSQFTRSYNFSIPFTLTLTGSPEQIILSYNGSGANSSSDYTWYRYERYVWVRQFMDQGEISFDYRPGERKVNGTWRSHNRGNEGWAERKSGSWYEMRTKDGGSGSGDPPERKISGSWKNQSKLGAE